MAEAGAEEASGISVAPKLFGAYAFHLIIFSKKLSARTTCSTGKPVRGKPLETPEQ